MKNGLRLSLAAKIVLLSVGVSGALALGLTALGYRKAEQGLQARTETALGAEARMTASLIDTWTRDRVTGLRALAALRSVRRVMETAASPAASDLDAAEYALGDLTAIAAEVDSVVLVDLNGKVIRGSNADEDGRDLSRAREVHEALQGHLFVGGVSVSPKTGQPAIYFAAPTLGSNATVIGCVRMRAKLDPLLALVRAAKDRAGPGAQGELINEAGVVVASSFAPELSPAGEELAAMHGAGTVRFPIDGVEQFGVAVPLTNTKYLYVASLPVSEVQRTARELLRNAIAAGVVGLLAALGLSLLVARKVVGSVKRLTEVSSRIVSEGDLTQVIEVNSDDEVGQLGRSFARMVDALREALTALKGSSGALSAAADNLRATMEEQARFIESQAATLQETQVTAQEIKQTSQLAAEKAEAVLKVAERADEIGRAGETSVERSLGGLEEISRQAAGVGEQIKMLAESARQIGSITGTVKDLADQSNMLALNAAIEAVRSGEHGKGFGVVAREIRSLADQSIGATNRVREILEELGGNIRSAVSITDVSAKRMETGMVEVKSSGENLRELSGITRENVAAVRQIAAAVSQQNAGISQIFGAVTDQMRMMEQVREHIERTNVASAELRAVAERVAGTLGRYRL